jgi:hypothetical protein
VSDTFGIEECRIFSFNLDVVGGEGDKIIFDPRVGATVMSLLSDFFEKNNDIIIYVADSKDGRHQQRQNKFIRWAKEYPIKGITIDQYTFGDILAGIIRKEIEEHEAISLSIRDELNRLKGEIGE